MILTSNRGFAEWGDVTFWISSDEKPPGDPLSDPVLTITDQNFIISQMLTITSNIPRWEGPVSPRSGKRRFLSS